MSYKNLEIWQIARNLATDIHRMTLRKLPKFEMYEEGSQIRRSSKSVVTNVVEGYGRRVYPAEYLRFLTYAIASNDETLEHLEILHATGSLKDIDLYDDLHERIDALGRKLNLFIKAIRRRTKSAGKGDNLVQEEASEYGFPEDTET